MADSIIPTGDLESAREFIANLRQKIEERGRACHEKIQRIRQRARADEDYEQERTYIETEPLRKQMEAMIQRVVTYESLKAPAPMIVPANGQQAGE